MYDLIMFLWGKSVVLDTGLSLDLCNEAIEHLSNTIPNLHLVTLTCTAVL